MQSPSSLSVKVLLTNKLAKLVMCLIGRVGSVPNFKSEKMVLFFTIAQITLKNISKEVKF